MFFVVVVLFSVVVVPRTQTLLHIWSEQAAHKGKPRCQTRGANPSCWPTEISHHIWSEQAIQRGKPRCQKME